MDYFRSLSQLLQLEKEEDRRSFNELAAKTTPNQRRATGMAWYPIAIRNTEIGRGDYLSIEVERTTHHDIIHQFRFGMSAALFSHVHKDHRLQGTITQISGHRLTLSLRTDELPDWTKDGKLGIDVVFDQNSYDEMEGGIKAASIAAASGKNHLVNVLTGQQQPAFASVAIVESSQLNNAQTEALNKIISAENLAIVHGPPGTGKTTTIVQAIAALVLQQQGKILVVAPSNAAVDLLTERIADEGLSVVRAGNPARVNDKLMSLTLDSRLSNHISNKEIKRLKKQASEFRDMAHKYKRTFGASEREQRKALFNEARNIRLQIDRMEQYIIDDVLANTQVITATLVGANHYSIRTLNYYTVVIDEAGQALEPATWIPILKTQKLVMAGDHCQLPPTIKSEAAAQQGLGTTLMEKMVRCFPEAVVLLKEQYRMNTAIMQFSSNNFYGGLLQANMHVANRLLFAGDAPVLFIDTAGCGFDEKHDTSISNPEEAAFLLKHLAALLQQLASPLQDVAAVSVAVIAPYRHQVEVLKELWQHDAIAVGAEVSINTVDSFQGQERDVVYISMTRSNTENSIGFLTDIRRMNVAMTRARKKLVVIGDSATIARHPFYNDFIEYVQLQNGYFSAWEFMEI